MKTPSGLARVLALIALLVCCPSFAAEPMLFRASGFVPAEKEASLLTKGRKLGLDTQRQSRFMRQVWLVEFDREALALPVISIEMPDHAVYRVHGVLDPGSHGISTWTGATVSDTTGKPTRTREGPMFLPLLPDRDMPLWLYFEDQQTVALGSLVLGSRTFSIQFLSTGYAVLKEDGLNPNSPPIDAGPPGPRPWWLLRRLRSSSAWPSDRVTDALRESLATSAIGGSMSPQSCGVNQINSCGTVTEFSCYPDEGPLMYFNNQTGAFVMACGTHCRSGPGLPGSKVCTACPPPEWTACQAAAKAQPTGR